MSGLIPTKVFDLLCASVVNGFDLSAFIGVKMGVWLFLGCGEWALKDFGKPSAVAVGLQVLIKHHGHRTNKEPAGVSDL